MALAAPDPMKEPQGTSEESGVCLTPWDAFSQDLRQKSVQTARSRQPWQAWNCGDRETAEVVYPRLRNENKGRIDSMMNQANN